MNAILRSGAAVAADIGLILGIVYLNLLIELSRLLSPACMMKEATGLACPVCGGTHAVQALMRGDIWGALNYNWFVILLLLYGAVVWLLANIFCFSGNLKVKKLLFRTIHYRVIGVLGVIAAVFFVSNNLILYGLV